MRIGHLHRAVIIAAALAAPGAQAQDAGAKLYNEACATCHGQQGQETARGQARRLDGVPEAEVRAYLLGKRAQEPKRPYERLKHALSDAEIDALAGYIATFAGR